MNVYITAATQVSMQQPLSEAWLTNPIHYSEPYVRSIDPDFRTWLSPLQSRRFGPLLKRTLATAIQAMRLADVDNPDAIVTGTGLGCIGNTEEFLSQMCQEGEELLKPTSFMQSTHNTISSLIAITTKCHGYNTTYSHKGQSFDSALLDAFLQLQLGDITTALVTGNDELTPTYYTILRRAGYLGQPGQVPAAEASVAMMLTTHTDHALCQIEDIYMGYANSLPVPDGPVDAIVVGTNGTPANDNPYQQLLDMLPPAPVLSYKPIFGESYTASALGVYAAAHILHNTAAPHFLCQQRDTTHSTQPLPVRRLLFLNHSDGNNFTYILMKR